MKRLLLPILLVTVALGGCSQTDDAAAPAPSASTDERDQLRAYAKCMRANGVDMPDPNGDGVIGLPAQKVGSPESKIMEAANEKCRTLMPAGGEPPKMSPEDIEKVRAQSKCMRENGVPSYPDPDPQTGAVALSEDDVKAEAMTKAVEKCQGLGPGSVLLTK
jgi:hypothetical protein